MKDSIERSLGFRARIAWNHPDVAVRCGSISLIPWEGDGDKDVWKALTKEYPSLGPGSEQLGHKILKSLRTIPYSDFSDMGKAWAWLGSAWHWAEHQKVSPKFVQSLQEEYRRFLESPFISRWGSIWHPRVRPFLRQVYDAINNSIAKASSSGVLSKNIRIKKFKNQKYMLKPVVSSFENLVPGLVSKPAGTSVQTSDFPESRTASTVLGLLVQSGVYIKAGDCYVRATTPSSLL